MGKGYYKGQKRLQIHIAMCYMGPKMLIQRRQLCIIGASKLWGEAEIKLQGPPRLQLEKIYVIYSYEIQGPRDSR